MESLIKHIEKLPNVLLLKILKYVDADTQLSLAMNHPAFSKAISRTTNLRLIPNLKKRSRYLPDQYYVRNKQEIYESSDDTQNNPEWSIGQMVEVVTEHVNNRGEITGYFRRYSGVGKTITGVIVNTTNKCCQNDSWLDIIGYKRRFYFVNFNEETRRQLINRDYAQVLLDLNGLLSLEKELNNYMTRHFQPMLLKILKQNIDSIQNNSLDYSWNYMVYVPTFLLKTINDDKNEKYKTGIVNPYLGRYFEKFCVNTRTYIMNSLWAKQFSTTPLNSNKNSSHNFRDVIPEIELTLHMRRHMNEITSEFRGYENWSDFGNQIDETLKVLLQELKVFFNRYTIFQTQGDTGQKLKQSEEKKRRLNHVNDKDHIEQGPLKKYQSQFHQDILMLLKFLTAIDDRANYGAETVSLKELAGLIRFKKDKNGHSMNLYCSSFQFLSDHFNNKFSETQSSNSSFDLRDVFDFENYKNLPCYKFLEDKLNEIRDEVFTLFSDRKKGSLYHLLYSQAQLTKLPSSTSVNVLETDLYLTQKINRTNQFHIHSKINREYVMFILVNLLFRNKITRSNIWNSIETV